MRRLLAVAMVLVFACACAPSRAELRREQVRAWREGRTDETNPRVPESIGPWRWGATVAEVLAQTEHAWVNEDGTEVGAPAQLGRARGLATFSFRAGQLVRIEVLVPNRDGAREEVIAGVRQTLGDADKSPASQAATTGMIVGAALMTLSLAVAIAASVAGHGVPVSHSTLYPWFASAPVDQGPINVSWHTPGTEATLTVEQSAIVLLAEYRR